MRSAALFSAAGALAIGLSACSVKDDNANLITGKQLFVQKCGSCHTLARAGTKGTVGPNLDQAFQEDKREKFGDSAIRGLVRKQIQFPARRGSVAGAVMPAGLEHGQKADDIAAYVASVSAEPGQDKGLIASAVKKAGSGGPAVEKNGVLAIAADPSGQLAYVTKTATATAGPVTIEMPNMSGVAHNLDVQGVGKTAIIPKGTAKFSATLKPGKYTFYCDVPGHRAAGMQGTLTVK